MTTSLQEYLRCCSCDAINPKKKKKKKTPNIHVSTHAITIIDADPVWQKEIKEISSEPEDAQGSEDDAPLVIKDMETKSIQRLEALRMCRPYISTAEDGSGWVEVTTASASTSDNGENWSPHDTSHSTSAEGLQPDVVVLTKKSSSSLDLSPPRKSITVSRSSFKGSNHEFDSSPQRHQDRSLALRVVDHSDGLNLAPDLSPPRHIPMLPPMSSLQRSFSPDMSPPRKRSLTLESSPPRRKSQISHNTIVHNLSPPRNVKHTIHLCSPRKRHRLGESGSRRGKDNLKEEMVVSMIAQNANTVYRDKHGRRLESLDELLKLQQVENAPKEDKPLEWGKGLVQRREQKEKLAEIEKEKAKPFARTRDDPELEKILKEEIRWGDPMAHLIKKKIKEGDVPVDLGASEQMKESGFLVPQSIPNHSWLKREFEAPPNRYNIKPGRHWDGVDRSVGYERDMYKRQNEKKADEVEAYLWSVADM